MVYKIKQGKNIKIKGNAKEELRELPLAKCVAVQPPDFRGFKPRVLVKVDAVVEVGTPLLEDKTNPDIKIVSPASGKVIAVNRGNKRALLEVVVETDGKQQAISFAKYSEDQIGSISKQDIIKNLMDAGLWPVIRQRPFSKIANPQTQPKAIFVHAMNTEPLAANVDFVLQEKEKEFQIGLNILKNISEGKVHLCIDAQSTSKALTDAKNVEIQKFSGAHPAGNVGTHIHCVDPLNKGEAVWYIEVQDVLRIAALFLTGEYSAERIVAITGEGAKENIYVKTIIGASLESILGDTSADGKRFISGSVLTGRNVGLKGFLGFYDSQITVIPEGGNRELLGWMMPGFNKYTISKTYASAFLPSSDITLDTDENGSHRAIVLNHLYDQYVTLDVMTYFLLKAILSEDIEEAERLGILECEDEDFALCTFACPSKVNVGSLVRKGLELIEKEG